MEGMRYDLEWLNVLVARLDHDLPPSRSARLEVELDRIHNELTRLPATSQRSDDQQERLLARCERLRGVLLGRRIRDRAGPFLRGASAERLLILWLEHSRLQARVAAIEATTTGDELSESLAGNPAEWAGALAVRRTELAERAEAQLQELGLEAARRPCERAAQHTRDEIIEVVAFVEDMPLRRAVSRLELAREDSEQLVGTLHRLMAASREDTSSAVHAQGRSPETGSEDQRQKEERQHGPTTDWPPGSRAWSVAANVAGRVAREAAGAPAPGTAGTADGQADRDYGSALDLPARRPDRGRAFP